MGLLCLRRQGAQSRGLLRILIEFSVLQTKMGLTVLEQPQYIQSERRKEAQTMSRKGVIVSHIISQRN